MSRAAGNVEAFQSATLLVFAGLFLGACGGDSEGEAATFARDVAPLLEQRCATRCHVAEDPDSSFLLLQAEHAYGELVGVPAEQAPHLLRVAPGDVEGSYLWHKLKGTHLEVGGEGESMPYAEPLLGASDLGVVERWIAGGAEE